MKKLRIGFLSVLGDEDNHTQMMNGIFEAADKHGVSILRYAVSVHPEDYEGEHLELQHMLKVIEAQKPDGLMFLGWMPGIAGKNFQSFIDRFSDIPLVSVGVNHPMIPSVHATSETPIRNLIRHLIEHHGYRNIVFVPPMFPDMRQGFYIEEMREHGLYRDELMVYDKDLKSTPMNDRIRHVAHMILDQRKIMVDAFFCVFDTDTQDLYIELARRGLSIPKDVAVVSNEDSEFARFSIPPVSVVTFPWREIGYLGCDKMVRVLRNELFSNARGVSGKLVLRSSCGCRSEEEKLSRVLERKPDIFLPGTGYGRLRDHLSDFSDAYSATSLDLERLADQLVETFETHQRGHFFDEFQKQLDAIVRKFPEHAVIDRIEDYLYESRSTILSYLGENNSDVVLFEDLFLMCNVLLQENRVVVAGYENTVIRKARREVISLCQEIGSTFNLEILGSTIEKGLSRVSIPSCYVYLATDDSFSDFSLLTAYANGRRLDPDREDVRAKLSFAALVRRHTHLMCQTLQVDEEFFGLIFFEPGILDMRIYEMLARQIASALKGALLHDDLKVEMELRKFNEMLILHNANFDALTDLYNRRSFDRTMSYLCGHDNTSSDKEFYLMYFDFDDFKKVNDTYGHDAGDELIREISQRIFNAVRRDALMVPASVKSDDPMAADEAVFRVGGDEFTALIRHMPRREMRRLATRVISSVRVPYRISGEEISVSLSIGISIFPADTNEASALIKQADTAMYRAKRKKGMFCFHDER